ncbi:MAG TPA: ATP-binding protein, partial [Calditrichaeota bacterium]|nr:ATP-binding protein [Calditrichota bacterium]
MCIEELLKDYASKHNVMQHNLIDREKEWAFLEEAYQKKQAQLIVLYGRRRVGKSFLSSKFVNKKNGIYFLCSKGNDREQLELLSARLADYFKDPALKLNPFTKWHDVFIYLSEKLKERQLVIEFDEFPYLIEANPAITSIFQKYWHEELSKRGVYLILCGSSISMMETHVLGYRSPLYGRRTGQWRLNPLHFNNVMKFFD